MNTFRILVVSISMIALLSGCSNKKEWEASLKQWEQAVKDRDKAIAKLQQQLQDANQQIQKLQAELAQIKKANKSDGSVDFLAKMENLGISEATLKKAYLELVDADDASYAEADKVMEDCEKMSLGMREGMQWHSREKLAAAHYNWAREKQGAGNLESALWNANMASQLSPSSLDARRLREDLVGEQVYRGEYGSMRLFMRKLVETDY